VFTQEKEKLIFHLVKDEHDFFLEISTNPRFSYIITRKNHKRAKKNTIDFFQKYLPASVLSVKIAQSDRIISFNFKLFTIYISFIGNLSNIFLIDSNLEFYSFKEYSVHEKEKMISLENNQIFNNSLCMEIDYQNLIGLSIEELKCLLPFIDKTIIDEIKIRSNLESNLDKFLIIDLINEIINQELAVYQKDEPNEVHLAPGSFRLYKDYHKTCFKNAIETINYFVIRSLSSSSQTISRNFLEKFLNKEINSLTTKIEKLTERLRIGSKEEEYKKFGNLLLINKDEIDKGLNLVVLQDFSDTTDSVKIKLNPAFSAVENATLYFEKAKSEIISYNKNISLLETARGKLDVLNRKQLRLISTKDPKEIEKIMQELNLKSTEPANKRENEKEFHFKHYLLSEKYHVYVGKNSRNNDVLTTKFAKQNDYWFHARGLSGSHVVLQVSNNKETVPKIIIERTAQLAALHSKGKTAKLVPVSYTLKKYVVKKKGMETGKVILLKENSIIVKPEIPEDCSFITD
jgi:predicted ribosome quality control (RQC) complex YloA/Tae2 family protein